MQIELCNSKLTHLQAPALQYSPRVINCGLSKHSAALPCSISSGCPIQVLHKSVLASNHRTAGLAPEPAPAPSIATIKTHRKVDEQYHRSRAISHFPFRCLSFIITATKNKRKTWWFHWGKFLQCGDTLYASHLVQAYGSGPSLGEWLEHSGISKKPNVRRISWMPVSGVRSGRHLIHTVLCCWFQSRSPRITLESKYFE